MNTSAYKFGLSEPGSLSYYDYGHTYVVSDSTPRINEYSSHMENSASIPSDRPAAVHTQHEEIPSSTSHVTPVDCKLQVSFCSEFMVSNVIWSYYRIR